MAWREARGKPGTVTLRVASGRHAGAELVLDEGRHSLGNSVETDIVLTDAGIATTHARLDLTPDGLRIVAVDSPVTLVGQGVIDPGFGTNVHGPHKITLGDVELDLVAPERIPPKMLSRRMRAAGLTALMLIPALMLLLSQVYPVADVWADARTGPTPSPPPARTVPALESTPAPAPMKPMVPDAGARISETALKTRLEAAGFADVSVHETGGSIRLRGRLPESRKAAWSRFRNALDIEFSGAVLHTRGLIFYADRIDVPKPPVIDSVWVTDAPFIVIAGRKHIEGSSVGKSWRVTKIETGAVTFLDGSRKVVVRLRGTTAKAQEVTDGSGQHH